MLPETADMVAAIKAAMDKTEALWSADDAECHLDTLFKPYERHGIDGTLRIGWRRNWSPDENFHHQFYLWPVRRAWYMQTAEKAVAAGVDAYCEFNLRVRDEQAEKHVRLRSSPPLLPFGFTVAFDLDEASKRGPDAIERLQKAGAMLVTSGTPGHLHAYVVSPEPVAMADLHWQRDAIKQALGLDRVLGLAQPLRLAGSANFKPSNAGGAPCRVVHEADPSRYERGLQDLLGDGLKPRTLTFGVDFGVGADGRPLARPDDWHDVAQGERPGRPHGPRQSSAADRSGAAYGWICQLWESGYDEAEAYALTLWTAKHGEVGSNFAATAAVDKYGCGDGLRWEVLKVYEKREGRSTEAERRDRPSRPRAAVPSCACCTAGGAS